MPEGQFSKTQMLELTGMAENNLAWVTKLGFIKTAGPVRRGQRPTYTQDEVLKAALMERCRALRVPYERSSAFVDQLREQSEREEGIRRAAGHKIVAGFWSVLRSKLDAQHIVWILIKDDEPKTMFLWRRPNPDPGSDEFKVLAAIDQDPADGFEHYVILNVGKLVRRITAVSRSS